MNKILLIMYKLCNILIIKLSSLLFIISQIKSEHVGIFNNNIQNEYYLIILLTLKNSFCEIEKPLN